MKTILSIQSHVAYGYVGNRAAIFPLQIMGYDVIGVNTVQFSNHTGYGSWTGQVFGPDHIQDVIDGLTARGCLNDVCAVLSGYLGDAELGEIIIDTVTQIKKSNTKLIYSCDPVMGDTGRGFFVQDAIPDFFKNTALSRANIITPNQFELAYLTNTAIETREDAIKACSKVHEQGVGTVLLTSLETKETEAETIQMMASTKAGENWVVTTPKLKLEPAPNGAGDMTAALFTGHIASGEKVEKALELTATSVFAIFEKTQWLDQRELAIIPAQDCFKISKGAFKAELVG